jgi:hypothetical protein
METKCGALATLSSSLIAVARDCSKPSVKIIINLDCCDAYSAAEMGHQRPPQSLARAAAVPPKAVAPIVRQRATDPQFEA